MKATEPSITYLVRMMNVLIGSRNVTVTNLAMMSRMNHKRCNSMIRWLQDSGYVQTKVCGKKRYVALSQPGREYAGHLLEVRDMTFPAEQLEMPMLGNSPL